MSNRIARRVLVAVRIGQALAIMSVCAGIAALYWNGVRYCGDGLRQLFSPEQVTFGDGRVQAYIPNCPGHEIHAFALGTSALLFGVVVLLGLRWLSAATRLETRTATTVMLWGIGLALLGIAIIPVENYAIGDFVEPTRHVLNLWSRVSRVPGAILVVGGVVVAVSACRRRLARAGRAS